ncbi:MAG: NusG domain II-containing protein [Bacillota bacterium]
MKKDKIEKLKTEKLISLPDVIIITAVILVALFVLFFVATDKTQNPQYNIYVENELYQTGSLSESAEIQIPTTDGGYATLIVEDGAIHMHDGNCADGLCEKQGEISTSASRIICLPNKIVVEITGGESGEIDAVS